MPVTSQNSRSSFPIEDAQDVAEFFKVLADPTRLRLVHAMAYEERSVYDLASSVGLTQSAVSHQLRALRLHHVVISRRSGSTIYYRLADFHVLTLLTTTLLHLQEPARE